MYFDVELECIFKREIEREPTSLPTLDMYLPLSNI